MDRTTEARRVLEQNDRGGYTVPTAGLYPFQWNWDSMFVALGWAEFDTARAWLEIETLFKAQWPSGMVPHIVFWSDESTYFPGPAVWRAGSDPFTSGISQPPVAATVVRQLASTTKLPQRSLFEAIDRWHRWWHEARDPEGRGVVAISHPWESGRDNLPDWDVPLAAVDTSTVGSYRRRDLDLVDADMRPHKDDYDRYLALVDFGGSNGWDDAAIATGSPFLVADPAISAILLRAERDLACLGAELQLDTADIEARIKRLETGFEQFWSATAGTYCSFDLRTGEQATVGTSASFLAPYAGIHDHNDELLAELEAWSNACAYLVPSFDPRDPRFEPKRYWRGPVWAVVNRMIAAGLSDAGEAEWAELVRCSTRDLIAMSGMAESFNPITGGPVGGAQFGWSAAMWLSWASEGATPS
jgi:glycogen debranching enzyme